MKMKEHYLSRIFFLSMGISGVAAPVLHASAADQMAVADTVDTGPVGGVSGSESLPLTKSVVSQESIEQSGTQDGYADAVKNVAGVASNNGKGNANDSVKFRGIQLNLFTDYRLNGGLPIAGVISFPTENKERIEALKGANALMFGIASPGGIINLVTKRAKDKDNASLTMAGSSFGQYGVAADVGKKFGDQKQFGLRVNVSDTHLENGIKGDNGTGQFGSVAADWKATNRLSFMLDYENYRKDVVEQAALNLLPVNPKTGLIAVPRPLDPTKLLSGTWAIYHPRTENTQFRSEYLLSDDWKLVGEVGRSDSNRSRLQTRISNYDLNTGAGTENIALVLQRYITTFAKAEAVGKFNTGPFRHELTLGVDSTKTDTRQCLTKACSASVSVAQNIYNPVVIANPNIQVPPQIDLPKISKNSGIYSYDAVGIGSAWKVLLGIRRTSSDFTDSSSGKATETKAQTSSPALGVLYDIAPATTIYASYMKGLEAGAVAPAVAKNAYEILPPGVATQIEVGVRTNYFDGISGNLAYFDITRVNAVTDPVTNIFASAGTNHFKGFEATLSDDLNRWWTVNFTGQAMTAVQDAQGNAINTLTPENTAKYIASLSVTHRSPFIPGLSLTAGSSYVGKRFINALDQGTIPGVTLFTASAAYTTFISGHRTSFQLSLDNIANKRYWNSAASGSYGAGMDRSVKVMAKIEM